MKPLKERNQALVGLVTVVLLALAGIVAASAKDIPVLSDSVTYSAYVPEAATLEPGNEVRIAGTKVGEVSAVELDGNRVRVDFTSDGPPLGDQTTASIEVKTLLGEKYLGLEPRGTAAQDPGEPIPVARTRAPFQIQDVAGKLKQTVGELDTPQLQRGLESITESLSGTPPYVRDALSGMSSLSTTIASRDQQLRDLLANTNQVSRTIADRSGQLQKLVADGDTLLAELQRRKQAISALLTGAQRLSDQLRGLVADNRATLRPTLDRLGQVTDVLRRNQDNLAQAVGMLGAFSRIGGNVTGSGRWFDGYICGLLLPPQLQFPGLSVNEQGCTPPVSAPNQGVRVPGGSR